MKIYIEKSKIEEAAVFGKSYSDIALKLGLPGRGVLVKLHMNYYGIALNPCMPKYGTKTKNCMCCGRPFTIKDIYTELKQCYCSKSCSNKAVHRRKKKSKVKNTTYAELLHTRKHSLERSHTTPIKSFNNKCRWDGREFTHFCKKVVCLENEIYYRHIRFLSYFGFNKDLLHTPNVWNEYNRVKNIILDEYFTHKLSLIDICKKYNYPDPGTLASAIKRLFKVNLRNHSESGFIVSMSGKRKNMKGNTIDFKTGYHTTFDGNVVYYRSSYELDFYKKLDKEKIPYLCEHFRIPYLDTCRNKMRVALPDIYIPSKNLIIEIKSFTTMSIQNMKDRFEKYRNLGYNVLLVYEKKEYSYEDFINNFVNNKSFKEFKRG